MLQFEETASNIHYIVLRDGEKIGTMVNRKHDEDLNDFIFISDENYVCEKAHVEYDDFGLPYLCVRAKSQAELAGLI